MKILVVGDAHTSKSRLIEILKSVHDVEIVYKSLTDFPEWSGINSDCMVIDELSEYTQCQHEILVERVEKKKANKPYYRKNERW